MADGRFYGVVEMVTSIIFTYAMTVERDLLRIVSMLMR